MNRIHLRGAILVAVLTALVVAQPSSAQDTGTPVAQSSGSAATARPTSRILERTFDVHLVQGTLAEALALISSKTGVRFAYAPEHVPLDKRVSLIADKITIKDALAIVLAGTGFDAVASASGAIRLDPVPTSGPAFASNAQQGTATIVGYVRDSATGASIPQVTVRIDGKTLETKSDANGQYKFTGVAAGEYRVTARRVGYLARTRTITLGEGQVLALNFELSPPATRLNDVVTTALGDQRRYQVGNVISTINVDSIAPTAPVTSVTDLISARAPGVEVMENSGVVGSGETIRIRGISSLVLQSDPIVIVDGVREDNTPGSFSLLFLTGNPTHPTPSRLNDLNFDDIETINILKGPTATTEYGTDAAAGVIVITTKHGASGAPLWHVDGEHTTTGLPHAYPQEYIDWGHETDGTQRFSGFYPGCTPILIYGSSSTSGNCVVDSLTAFNPLNDPATTLFHTGDRQKYDLSVSGGSDAVRYFMAGGMSNETGVIRLPSVFRSLEDSLGITLPAASYRSNTEQQRTIRLNTAIRLSPTADVNTTVAYLATSTQNPNVNDLLASPENGTPIDDAAYLWGYSGYYNAISTLSDLGTDQDTRLTGGVTANWQPLTWFTGHAEFGIDHGGDRQQETNYPVGNQNWGNFPSLYLSTNTNDIYTVDVRGSATASVARDVRAVTSAGLQMVESNQLAEFGFVFQINISNISLDGYPPIDLGQHSDQAATLGGYLEEVLSVQDRLFLTGAVRIDGASGFGSAYAVATYPKASVSWLAIKTAQTTLRLRGAFGESGEQPQNGAALLLFNAAEAYSGGALVPSEFVTWPGNPNLQPDRSQEYEGGIDVGLLGNRVSLEVTAYRKVTQHALSNVSLGGDVCCYTYQENIGEIANTGWETMATVALIDSRLLTWSATATASVNHNKFVSLAPGVFAIGGGSGNPNAYPMNVGYPLDGVWSKRIRYADINHDGIMEPDEVSPESAVVFLGPSAPTREASLASDIGMWRGAVHISAMLDYRGGFRLWNQAMAYADEAGITPEAALLTTPLWEQARVAVLNSNSFYYPGCCVNSSSYFEDGSYLRFRELSVTYALPRSLARRVHAFDNLSITGAVRNLALWTRYTGIDPEVTNVLTNGLQYGNGPGSGSNLSFNNDIRGDQGTVPLLRDWVIRLNLGLK